MSDSTDILLHLISRDMLVVSANSLRLFFAEDVASFELIFAQHTNQTLHSHSAHTSSTASSLPSFSPKDSSDPSFLFALQQTLLGCGPSGESALFGTATHSVHTQSETGIFAHTNAFNLFNDSEKLQNELEILFQSLLRFFYVLAHRLSHPYSSPYNHILKEKSAEMLEIVASYSPITLVEKPLSELFHFSTQPHSDAQMKNSNLSSLIKQQNTTGVFPNSSLLFALITPNEENSQQISLLTNTASSQSSSAYSSSSSSDETVSPEAVKFLKVKTLFERILWLCAPPLLFSLLLPSYASYYHLCLFILTCISKPKQLLDVCFLYSLSWITHLLYSFIYILTLLYVPELSLPLFMFS